MFSLDDSLLGGPPNSELILRLLNNGEARRDPLLGVEFVTPGNPGDIKISYILECRTTQVSQF